MQKPKESSDPPPLWSRPAAESCVFVFCDCQTVGRPLLIAAARPTGDTAAIEDLAKNQPKLFDSLKL